MSLIACTSPGVGFTSSGAPVQKKMWGPYYMNTPRDCLHPTRTLVIIDILLRSRAAMHTTSAAARHTKSFPLFPNHYFISYHVAKNGKKILMLLWGLLFVGPLFGRTCWTCLNPPLTSPPYTNIDDASDQRRGVLCIAKYSRSDTDVYGHGHASCCRPLVRACNLFLIDRHAPTEHNRQRFTRLWEWSCNSMWRRHVELVRWQTDCSELVGYWLHVYSYT